jgi:hypothetical protein
MNRSITQYKLFMGHDTSSLLKNTTNFVGVG